MITAEHAMLGRVEKAHDDVSKRQKLFKKLVVMSSNRTFIMMNQNVKTLIGNRVLSISLVLSFLSALILVVPPHVLAQPPEPVVAIHVSELTQALDTMNNGWWTSWHYFVLPESLKEALRSDGTPFVEVSDADIAAGSLLFPDGSPRYPILISLAAEAIDNNAIAPLRDYVAAGGFLFVGSSSFTRNPDGTTRGDFALADELGLHMVNPSLQNWGTNMAFSKAADHRLVAHIPAGTIAWRMPLSSDEISLGVSPYHAVHGNHYVFRVNADSGTTVIANGYYGIPLLATRPYGNGTFIYDGEAQPLIGHGVYDPVMYSYLIYRQAIEWAFETANMPIMKLSPWPYEYDAAFIVRHDFENNPTSIRSIESSAWFESSIGAKGDYYFCTGTLREEMLADQDEVILSLRSAVTNYGASIGSHNGGLKNPVNDVLSMGEFDYWHWGPDEALDVTPTGYASGKEYAAESISLSFSDIEGWLAGVDNGRAGCGSAGNCPRLWASPYFNSTREGSYQILEELGAVASSKGEQKISPFPHMTISYETPGKHYAQVSLPASDWYVGTEIPGAIEWGHSTASIQAAVDFYYNRGFMINLYGHIPSNAGTLIGQYAEYCVTKPRMWSSNSVEIADWWQVRSNAVVTPSYSVIDNTIIAQVTITGATDPDTAIEVAIPNGNASNPQVLINDAPADPADYRTVGNVVKVRVGASPSSVKVQYAINNPVPAITGLSPAAADAGDADFTLTVNGSGFVAGSIVQWNGVDRATTYVSSTRLTAAIPAADIAAEATAAVTVFNPPPEGGTSNAQTFTINNPLAQVWTQSNWAGGAGQPVWADATRYDSASGIDTSVTGQISLASTSSALFTDDFSRGDLQPWVTAQGTWTITDGVLQGSGDLNQYSYAYYSTTPQWTDYAVQGSIQIPEGSFGGGIGGRIDPATGAHYGAWVYPAGSGGGSNVLKLWKFQGWADLGSGIPMHQVTLPDVGTGWHTLQMTFIGNRILVYYEGELKIDVTDVNYDNQAPYISGGISADWWTGSLPYTIAVDNISVTTPVYGSSGVLFSSAYDGGEDVQWQSISWDGAAGGSTNVCVRTRTAGAADQLASAPWSDCYSASGSGITSGNSRWIQYQLELTTSDPSVSPVLNEIRISYFGSTTTSIPSTTTTVQPTTSSSTSSTILTTSVPTTTTTAPAPAWTQSNWAGGAGQPVWADATRYDSASGIDTSVTGQISLASTSSALFTDDFSRGDLQPWVTAQGTWTITDGVLQGSGDLNQYSYAYYSTTPQWTDYAVQGSIQIPEGSFGGGIGGRIDPATGAHYGAWVYPAGSGGGSNVLKLWKFQGWADLGS